jgi:hypothetical protein
MSFIHDLTSPPHLSALLIHDEVIIPQYVCLCRTHTLTTIVSVGTLGLAELHQEHTVIYFFYRGKINIRQLLLLL